MIFSICRSSSISAMLILVALSSTASTPQAASPGLTQEPVLRAKTPEYISQKARRFLAERDGDIVKAWVFFTDKGVFDKRSFRAAAASVSLTERALKRRAKVALDKVVFVDLPVARSYIQQIVGLGAKHRRSSRWLNAASFEIPVDRLDQIGALPFVAYLKPLMSYRNSPVIVEDLKSLPQKGALAPDALDYGYSFGQLQQINVPAMHAKGYTGQGVTLAIFDTGFRKTHNAFVSHYSEGRVLAEWDFVQNDGNTSNEIGDAAGQWNHGTYIWSVSGGAENGFIYGPAYKANFILCKTEDISSETPVEEDNWVAALEFVDSIGADVVTSSLAYLGWDSPYDELNYTYSDLNGRTATTTVAANTCDGLGIVLCNAMANAGPDGGSLHAPADAFDILAVGAVYSTGGIVGFSSRGPTFDGRTKPEVCAQGYQTYAASSSSDGAHTYVSGTSLSTPLVAGAACLLIEARPSFTPAQIREALKSTADHADNPDNSYGWGIIDVDSAGAWGVGFHANNFFGPTPLEVSFVSTAAGATVWQWDFGDGETSTEENPTHTYQPGYYTVELTATTPQGDLTHVSPGLVLAYADTVIADDARGLLGASAWVDISAHHFLPVSNIVIPFSWSGPSEIEYDSFSTAGLRTDYFETKTHLAYSSAQKQAVIYLSSSNSGTSPYLDPGDGPIASLWFSIPQSAAISANPIEISSYIGYSPVFGTCAGTYPAATVSGSLRPTCCVGPTLGNVDCSPDNVIDIGDVSACITNLFISLNPFCCEEVADLDFSGEIDIGDVSLLIRSLFVTLESLPPCP